MNHTLTTVPADDTAISALREYRNTLSLVGYLPRSESTPATYAGLGFKSGLEIHQQLLTDKKLFCHCPAGLYQHGDFDAEVIRHMRPTLSEMGEYDGTALMEKKTRKTIVYRIKSETACTYDIDDTPPFKIDRQALNRAIEIALMLKCNLVGELHVTRKQYLDGSIPTGFQRTGIIGIEGEIQLKNKKIRIIQLSLEEDSCREISDIGHTRVYTTDRLGMPLVESVTYPEMLTPDEVAEAAQYLRLLVRTSGKVRTGIGAAREDVNVSIEGGTRVEIKGVSHIKWIPNLTHIEAFRQKSLLRIKDELARRIKDRTAWKIASAMVPPGQLAGYPALLTDDLQPGDVVVAVNLPHFDGLLSHFTQPGKCFANEISDRLKVIACLERPNLIHSESGEWLDTSASDKLTRLLKPKPEDAQLVFWGPVDDVKTALETIEERCLIAFDGVPNETRKGLPNGTTLFERVLPGPDRMYPDTDSAPIAISNEQIESIRGGLTQVMPEWRGRLIAWGVPEDTHHYLIYHQIFPAVSEIADGTGWSEKYVGVMLGQTLKGALRKSVGGGRPDVKIALDICRTVAAKGYDRSVAKEAVSLLAAGLDSSIEELIGRAVTGKLTLDQALSHVKDLAAAFDQSAGSKFPQAKLRWIVGQLRTEIAGDVNPAELALRVARELEHV